MVIIKDGVSFGEAWQALMSGDLMIAFAYWKKGSVIIKAEGFIYSVDWADCSIKRSWRPDPVEMVQNYWMIFR